MGLSETLCKDHCEATYSDGKDQTGPNGSALSDRASNGEISGLNEDQN